MATFHLYYLDDSGAAATGYTTFTWLRLAPERWAAAQRTWLAYRDDLDTRYRIPPRQRLHATDLAAGRGTPSIDRHFDLRRYGHRIIHEGLQVIGGLAGLSVGTVYRRGGHPGRAKRDLYRALAAHLDQQLRDADALGMIFIDGGENRGYVTAHQVLDPHSRGLIEKPVFRSANQDQWVQMADFAAWSAYQSLAPGRASRRARTWYPTILGPIDHHGGPIPL
jgi:hypothetical protein